MKAADHSLAEGLPVSTHNQTRNILYGLAGSFQNLIAPGLRHSQDKYRELLMEKVVPGCDWLDIGCGHELLPDWLRGSRNSQEELVSRSRLAVGVDCGDDRAHVALDAKYHA